ncbi:MAG: hypothetical protein DHS20C15_20170 [Planctomycetota bacterium]|nr:MAG: hypothetical protein DHS20C15_20170 [Planctomycetota bacterium]
MTHEPNPLTPAIEEALRDEAHASRLEAPATLHAAIMDRVQADRAQADRVPTGGLHVAPRPVLRLSWRKRFALPLAAAVVVLLAGWGSQHWMQSKRAELAPVSMQVLQEVTAAPARAVRRLTDAPRLREAGRELRGVVAEEFDGLSARASAMGWELARRLGGPLSKLGSALR